jgi:hypothetical protein
MAESRTIKHSFKTESTTGNAGCRNHCVARRTRDQAFDRALNYSTTAPLPLRPTSAADARLQYMHYSSTRRLPRFLLRVAPGAAWVDCC